MEAIRYALDLVIWQLFDRHSSRSQVVQSQIASHNTLFYDTIADLDRWPRGIRILQSISNLQEGNT